MVDEKVRMSPRKFALQDNVDVDLFVYWNDQLMDRKEFDKVKKLVMGK